MENRSLSLQAHASNTWRLAAPWPADGGCDPAAVALPAAGDEAFTLLGTPAPAYDRTVFGVFRAGPDLILLADLYDSLRSSPAAIEVFCDSRHDHAGFFQFCFAEGREPEPHHFLPYPEYHSSAAPWPRVLEHRWFPGRAGEGRRFMARFAVEELFAGGPLCGFNLARQHPAIREASSWNHSSGMGFRDAGSFGHLYRDAAPVGVQVKTLTLAGHRLECSGTLSRSTAGFRIELVDPLGDTVPMRLDAQGALWSGSAELPRVIHGRYRLIPRLDTASIEPDYVAFDVRCATPDRAFTLGMTFDIGVDIRANPLTPEGLHQAMDRLARNGFSRIYWIGAAPAAVSGFNPVQQASPNARLTFERCGELLPLAARTARSLSLECMAVFKVFDLGINDGAACLEALSPDEAARRGLVRDIEGWHYRVIPEIAAHPEATMQRHAGWASPSAHGPLARLRIHSRRPIEPLAPGDIVLKTSRDNRTYVPYEGHVEFRQGRCDRPHLRWTPAGIMPEPGRHESWFIELSGLSIDAPFMAIERKHGGLPIENQAFLLVEGFDAAGRVLPFTLGSQCAPGWVCSTEGFYFGKGWPGWMNYTEKIVDAYRWEKGPLAVAWTVADRLPTLLEPACEQAHAIWLGQIGRILDCGVDGVDLRILCHHNACVAWLNYAYAGSVRDAFRDRHGREPCPTAEDYEQVRRLRGEGFTRFLRKARALVAGRGRKLAIHLEPGVELDPAIDSRMQIHFDFARWIEEGLMDEITAKFSDATSPFLHQRVLPHARRKGIPVVLCDRNASLCVPRAIELGARQVGEARAAGFAGLAFYEHANYARLNRAGYVESSPHVDAALRRCGEAG